MGEIVEVIPGVKKHRSEAAWEVATYAEPASYPAGHHWVDSRVHGRIDVSARRIRRAVLCACTHASGEHRLGAGCARRECSCSVFVARLNDRGLSDLVTDLDGVLKLADEVEASPDRATRLRLVLVVRVLVSEVRLRSTLMSRLDGIIGARSLDEARRGLAAVCDEGAVLPVRRSTRGEVR